MRENERITTFEAHDARVPQSVMHEKSVDLILVDCVAARSLADVDEQGTGVGECKDR